MFLIFLSFFLLNFFSFLVFYSFFVFSSLPTFFIPVPPLGYLMEPEFLFASKEFSFNSTNEIPIPKDPLDQVIGQDEAVKIANFAAKERRNVLFVGAPGIGKSFFGIMLRLISRQRSLSLMGRR